MPLQLTKTHARLWSLDQGIAMVVTDLHGDWDTYVCYRERFFALQAASQADCLIFTGDLIHRESGGEDRSLDIVLDVLRLQKRYGEAIIYLCGNHELAHIYGFILGKGPIEYTPSFEAILNHCEQRQDILALFDSLPLFIRSAAGVWVTHAGASPPLTNPLEAAMLFDWSHKALHNWANVWLAESDRDGLRNSYARLSGAESYAELAQHYLAISNPQDSRYDNLLRGFITTAHPDFPLLRTALFTRCEREHGDAAYAAQLNEACVQLSTAYAPQHILVAGHMVAEGGHTIVAGQHLRLASGPHARPPSARQYLLFDAARAPSTLDDLCTGLRQL